ncbi:MAG: tetratricopeptide repeat protein, partial [Spirochaetales bacterium]|nr:tetratricopeptide repeat protein [Spirochaetales bacterium]
MWVPSFPESVRVRRLFAATLLALLAAGRAGAVDHLILAPALVSPESAQSRQRVDVLVLKATALANRSYGDWIEVSAPAAEAGTEGNDGPRGTGGARVAEGGTYRVSVVAVLEDNPVVALTIRGPGAAEQERSFALLGAPGPESALYFARALFFLWASGQEGLRVPAQPPPAFLDELPTAALAESLLPGMSAALMPFSAAVTAKGSVILGLSLFAVEMERNLRVTGTLGMSLYETGTAGAAQSLTASPEGTVYTKAAMGSELYCFRPGAEEPRRIRLQGSPYGPLAALPDGSVALLNTMDRRLWRVENQRVRQVPLAAGPDAWPTAMATGPENTLWIYYPAERRVKVHAPTGELLDSILPLMDYGQPIEASAMAVYPDGRFLLYGRQGLWCFARSGLPLWRLEELPALVPGNSAEPLPQPAGLALDPAAGVLYLTDLTGGRLLKLLDRTYCRDFGIHPEAELELLRLNEQQRAAPRDAAATVEKALLYEQAGAFEMARLQWERALEIEPANRRAEAALASVDRKLARSAAARARDKAVRILEEIGPESARRHYQAAMQLYERLLSRYPQEGEAREEMGALRERFEDRTRGSQPQAPEQALALERIEAENLFPALMHEYHRRPVLRVELRNTLEVPVESLRGSVFVERFMDFPWESRAVDSVGPGVRVVLELKIPLNPEVLELEEDLPVQGRVEISYRVGPEARRFRSSVGLMIHRRTALRWDDSGRLSSFITPNEGVVSSFALRVSAAAQTPNCRLSDRFLRAMQICDALGAFGVRYVEDPDSPISRVLGRQEVVDTVRFPRVTLQVRSGDCDDTTALLASLLEAAGVRTAIMTSPGHVFLAFDTGESPSTAWLLEGAEHVVVVREGTVWLPVETTGLPEGFPAAWRQASRLYQGHAGGGEIELLPVRELRERYPPIPLAPSSLPVVEPSAGEIDALTDRSFEELERGLYRERLEALEQELRGQQGTAAARLANRIGILHAMFGRDQEAERGFRRALGALPAYEAAAVNLANLQIMHGRLDDAEEVLQQAIRRDRQSPAVNLLLALLYHRRGDRRAAREHFRVVERRDPQLAARFPYLAENGQPQGG